MSNGVLTCIHIRYPEMFVVSSPWGPIIIWKLVIKMGFLAFPRPSSPCTRNGMHLPQADLGWCSKNGCNGSNFWYRIQNLLYISVNSAHCVNLNPPKTRCAHWLSKYIAQSLRAIIGYRSLISLTFGLCCNTHRGTIETLTGKTLSCLYNWRWKLREMFL